MSTAAPPLEDRRALGAILADPEIQARRHHAGWLMNISRRDHAARTDAYAELVHVLEALRTGRRLDLIADDLRHLADVIEFPPQPHAGGWPIRPYTRTGADA